MCVFCYGRFLCFLLLIPGCFAFWCFPCFACVTAKKYGECLCLPLLDYFGFIPAISLSMRVSMRQRYGIRVRTKHSTSHTVAVVFLVTVVGCGFRWWERYDIFHFWLTFLCSPYRVTCATTVCAPPSVRPAPGVRCQEKLSEGTFKSFL